MYSVRFTKKCHKNIEDVEDEDGVQLEQLVTNKISGFRRSETIEKNKATDLKPT